MNDFLHRDTKNGRLLICRSEQCVEDSNCLSVFIYKNQAKHRKSLIISLIITVICLMFFLCSCHPANDATLPASNSESCNYAASEILDDTIVTSELVKTEQKTDEEEIIVAGKTFSGYYRNLLSEAEINVYDLIAEAIENHIDSVKIPSGISNDKVFRICNYIFCDHPEWFWYSEEVTVNDYGTEKEAKLTYLNSAEEAVELNEQVATVVNPLIQQLQGKTDYEKVKGIYEFLVLSSEYDISYTDEQSMIPLLLNNRGVCASYAKSAQYILTLLGIETIYVYGEAINRGSHAWNIVKIDGKWYQLDVTWGDPIDNPPDNICYNFLCLTTEEILRSRLIDSDCNVPVCSDRSYDFYVLNGLLLDNYDFEAIRSHAQACANSGETCYVKFTNAEDYQMAFNELLKNNQLLSALTNVYRIHYNYDDELYCFSVQFSS